MIRKRLLLAGTEGVALFMWNVVIHWRNVSIYIYCCLACSSVNSSFQSHCISFSELRILPEYTSLAFCTNTMNTYLTQAHRRQNIPAAMISFRAPTACCSKGPEGEKTTRSKATIWISTNRVRRTPRPPHCAGQVYLDHVSPDSRPRHYPHLAIVTRNIRGRGPRFGSTEGTPPPSSHTPSEAEEQIAHHEKKLRRRGLKDTITVAMTP